MHLTNITSVGSREHKYKRLGQRLGPYDMNKKSYRRAMKTLVGIFTSPLDAATAYKELRSLGIAGEDLIVFTPETSQQQARKGAH